jgi:hypothetical protein
MVSSQRCCGGIVAHPEVGAEGGGESHWGTEDELTLGTNKGCKVAEDELCMSLFSIPTSLFVRREVQGKTIWEILYNSCS